MYFTQKFFIPDSYGKVLCHNSKDDAVYLYDGKNMVKKCQFKLDEDLLGIPGESWLRDLAARKMSVMFESQNETKDLLLT